MFLTLEKFDSYDDGVSFNTKVFATLELAKVYALSTYRSYLDDLIESEADHEAFTPSFEDDGEKAPLYYQINADCNYFFCIQIQRIPNSIEEAKQLNHNCTDNELIELSDSNGI